MSDCDMIRREAEELIAFLRGAAPLHGCWFGERHHDRPAFWWRNELGRLERAIPAADTRPVQDDAASRRRKIMGHMDDRAAADARAEALKEASQALNERGVREQADFGLDRGAQNFFRARDIVRALEQEARE